ncbi:MAG: hypothetical protein V3V55_06725 [Rhodospirillales bacterium]
MIEGNSVTGRKFGDSILISIANHLAWAKKPTIWHGPKSQPFGMGQKALPFANKRQDEN